ncbi:TetR/AcrR family transcriptional regulator [Streptomyces sp. NPDC127092]|uniref:TetR/AcrR family transcriptional regulator n=1 Tax=Streptomyces sp. NPDC127092 TaxID=3347135 RepID=UPI00365F15B6
MRRAGITPDLLVQAAAELADEDGLDNVTVSALARRFGVKDASLYSHIRNLRDLRVRLALLASSEMNDAIGAAVAGRSGKDALVAFADAYRDYALAHPGRYAATQQRIEPAEVTDSTVLLRAVELTYGMLRGYGLGEPDLTDAGRLLRATFHGYIHIEQSGGFQHTRPVAESWARSLDALHTTLETWGNPS